jgi:hypothetical protein
LNVGVIKSVSNKQILSMYQTTTKRFLGLVDRRKISLGDHRTLTQMAEMMKSKKAGLCLVVETKRYLPYVSGLKVLIPVIDTWASSEEVIRQDVVKCLEEPRLGKAWDLGV